jgi:hypothetical protein
MRHLIPVVAVISLLSAGSLQAEPLSLPVQGEVTEIVTTWNDGIHAEDQISRITDPAQIESALAALRSLNSGLRKPGSKISSPQFITRYLRGESEVLIIFVGKNWMGGREGTAVPTNIRIRRISAEQRHQFLSSIGIQ